MRKKIFVLLLASLLIILPGSSYADDDAGFGSEPYDFPIRPKTDAWAELTTHDEMVAVTNIPQEVLENMTTADLVETILDYPLLMDIMAYNNYRNGFLAILNQFNGIEELVNRDDRLKEVFKAMTESNESWERSVLEILLAQPEITADSVDSDGFLFNRKGERVRGFSDREETALNFDKKAVDKLPVFS